MRHGLWMLFGFIAGIMAIYGLLLTYLVLSVAVSVGGNCG